MIFVNLGEKKFHVYIMLNQSCINFLKSSTQMLAWKATQSYRYMLYNHSWHVHAYVQWNANNFDVKASCEVQRIILTFFLFTRKSQWDNLKNSKRGTEYDLELFLFKSTTFAAWLHCSFDLNVCPKGENYFFVLRIIFLFFSTHCIEVTTCFSHKQIY